MMWTHGRFLLPLNKSCNIITFIFLTFLWLVDSEKRERRALERKLSEMEEELKVSNYWFFDFFLELRKGFLLDLGIFFPSRIFCSISDTFFSASHFWLLKSLKMLAHWSRNFHEYYFNLKTQKIFVWPVCVPCFACERVYRVMRSLKVDHLFVFLRFIF